MSIEILKRKYDLEDIPENTNFVVVYRGFGEYSTSIFGDTYRFSGGDRTLQVLNGSEWTDPQDHWIPADGFDMVEAIMIWERSCG